MRYLSLFALAALLGACHPQSSNTSQNHSGIKLTEYNYLNLDTAMLVYRGTTGANPAADKKFLEAIDKYRNKKDPKGALSLFRASILLQPQAKAYYEMGNALLDLDNASEALGAYAVAEAMNYKPLYKVFFNMGCAYAHLNKGDSAAEYVVTALEFGYPNIKNVTTDKDLMLLNGPAHDDYEWRIRDVLKRGVDPEKMEWAQFTHEMPVLDLPITLDMKYGPTRNLDQISFDYERYIAEMRNERFARETGEDFLAVGTVRNSDSVRTLVYATQELFDAGDIQESGESAVPFIYYMASYTQQGKLIDKMIVGGREKLSDPFKVVTIQPNGDFDITQFDLVYEKKVEDSGYTNNKLKEQKELNKTAYSIAADGHFVARNGALTMR